MYDKVKMSNEKILTSNRMVTIMVNNYLVT